MNNMKQLCFLFVPLFLTLSSCTKEMNPINCNDDQLKAYEGSYGVVMMDWVPEEGLTTTVDINNDGVASNDLVTELMGIHSYDNWRKTMLIPDSRGNGGMLCVYIPIMDYYKGNDGNLNYSGVCFPLISVKVKLSEDGSLSSERFERFEFPEENRIGLKTFGGVEITEALPGHITLHIDNYMVYDYVSRREIVGKMTVHMEKK